MNTTETLPDRPVWPALKRGLRLRCPKCGQGASLYAYVKVNDSCSACNEPLHHHRADDMPPYITILIVGHIIIPLVLAAEMNWAPETWVHWVIFIPMTLILSLLMLPRVKSAVVAIQWANRMHGFGGAVEEEIKPWEY